jgi:hypothetical protein
METTKRKEQTEKKSEITWMQQWANVQSEVGTTIDFNLDEAKIRACIALPIDVTINGHVTLTNDRVNLLYPKQARIWWDIHAIEGNAIDTLVTRSGIELTEQEHANLLSASKKIQCEFASSVLYCDFESAKAQLIDESEGEEEGEEEGDGKEE